MDEGVDHKLSPRHNGGIVAGAVVENGGAVGLVGVEIVGRDISA